MRLRFPHPSLLSIAIIPVLTLTLRAQTGKPMHATGPFDVAVKPESAGPPYPRMTLTKHYHGALEAQAGGEMLTGGDFKAGNAGYIAMETVTGTLDGRIGTFQLMQMGTMAAGKPELRCVVVPGSGTGALSGLTGTCTLDPSGGQHTYTLDYALPNP